MRIGTNCRKGRKICLSFAFYLLFRDAGGVSLANGGHPGLSFSDNLVPGPLTAVGKTEFYEPTKVATKNHVGPLERRGRTQLFS